MKSFYALLVLTSGGFLWAAESTEKSNDSKMIVIEEGSRRSIEHNRYGTKVFVETGKEAIAGSPEQGVKAAYRSWDQKCQEWKMELKKLNKSNLMVSNCGTPKRSQETIQSEKWYTYQSMGTYKIRVSNQ